MEYALDGHSVASELVRVSPLDVSPFRPRTAVPSPGRSRIGGTRYRPVVSRSRRNDRRRLV